MGACFVDSGDPFRMAGQWYKGALHVHTTRSDGGLSPDEAVAAYRERGYHLVAVTDHGVIADVGLPREVGLLCIPSVEVDYDRNAVGQSYHIVILGTQRMIELPPQTPVQTAIDRWAETGAVMFLAHPYWSGMTAPEVTSLRKLTGLEVFNTSADTDMGKGLATVHWDGALAQGKRWWGYAVDDTHWMGEDGRFYDAFGGWVWVKAEKLEEQAVLRALRNGQFYSSRGPLIHDFRVKGGYANLRCSEVVSINLIGHTQWGRQRRAGPGETICEARYRLTGNERYLRAECVDARGRTAWTNPLFLCSGPACPRGQAGERHGAA